MNNNPEIQKKDERKKRKKFIIAIWFGSIVAITAVAVILTTFIGNKDRNINVHNKKAETILFNALAHKTLVVQAEPINGDNNIYKSAVLTKNQRNKIFNKLVDSITKMVMINPVIYDYDKTVKAETVKTAVKSWIVLSSFKITPVKSAFTEKINQHLFYKEYTFLFNVEGIKAAFSEKLFKYTSLKESAGPGAIVLNNYSKALEAEVNLVLQNKKNQILNLTKLQNIAKLNINGVENTIADYLLVLKKTKLKNATLSTLSETQKATFITIQNGLKTVISTFQKAINDHMNTLTTLKEFGSSIPVGQVITKEPKVNVNFIFNPSEFRNALSANFPILKYSIKTVTIDKLITDLKQIKKLFFSTKISEGINLAFDKREIKNIQYFITDFIGDTSSEQTLLYDSKIPGNLKIKIYKTSDSIAKRIEKYYSESIAQPGFFDLNLHGDIKPRMIEKVIRALYRLIDKIKIDDLVKSNYGDRPYLINFKLANGNFVISSSDNAQTRENLIKNLQTFEKSHPDQILKVNIKGPTDVSFDLLGTLSAEVQGLSEPTILITPLHVTSNRITFNINTSVLELLDKSRRVRNVFSENIGQFDTATISVNTLLINRLKTVWNQVFPDDQIVANDIKFISKKRIDLSPDSPIVYKIGIQKNGVWLLPVDSYLINVAG